MNKIQIYSLNQSKSIHCVSNEINYAYIYIIMPSRQTFKDMRFFRFKNELINGKHEYKIIEIEELPICELL